MVGEGTGKWRTHLTLTQLGKGFSGGEADSVAKGTLPSATPFFAFHPFFAPTRPQRQDNQAFAE